MKFVSLHHHSTFSYLDGFGLPEDHVARAADLGYSAMALTEHGNISSHPQLEKACKDTGVKPIYGVEAYTGPVSEEKRGQRKNHLTILAEDQDGYKNLLRAVSQGWVDFYYEPTIGLSVLDSYKEGLIILSGCNGSLLATSLIGGKNVDPKDASYERARRVAEQFKDRFGDSYFLEVQQFPELDGTRLINEAYEKLGAELGIPLVATADVHYPIPSDSDMQMILHNVRGGGRQSLEDQARAWNYDVKLTLPTNDKELAKRMMATGLSKDAAVASIMNTIDIAERCSVELPRMPMLRYPADDARKVWKDWIREGWEYRGLARDDRVERSVYMDRLKYEIGLIESKDYVDYFLIVSDMVKWAKDNGILVGPARGSAAASLVCYLLRITEVNPMWFPNLVFERFIDITRTDLPDIDLDFDDERRDEIREYLANRYGHDKVGLIGSFVQYKSKNSIDDVARVNGIPPWEVAPLKDSLIERSSGDLRASATVEDTVEMFPNAAAVIEKYPVLKQAMRLEGNMRGMGVHAAGIIVASHPITDCVAIYRREVAGKVTEVISADKYDAEDLGLLKIDVLGLSTMGMIKHAISDIGMAPEELYGIPLDDPDTIQGFRESDIVGIFQFDGRAMRLVNESLKPDNFQEVCDVNALARPGPLHAGSTYEYVDAKFGAKPERFHPMLDAITEGTRYQIIYQEQILRIVTEIGKFDWTHAAYIRKIISRKIGEQEFNRQWDRFWEGADQNGLDEKTAREIWDRCITAGSYAFNAAHCVSYGMLAYWTMWLKRHHPGAFYKAALRKLPDHKQYDLLRDAERHGLRISTPTPDSGPDWEYDADHEMLIAGLTQIHGIGMKTAEAIMAARGDLIPATGAEWDELVKVKGIGPKTVEKIKEFGLDPDPFGIHYFDNAKKAIIDFIEEGPVSRLPLPTHKSSDIPHTKGSDLYLVWLGQIQDINLRDIYEINFSRTGQPLDPTTVKSPDLNEYALMYGKDEDGIVTLRIDRFKYPQFKDAIWGLQTMHDMVLVRGVKLGRFANKVVYVKEMWVIDPD